MAGEATHIRWIPKEWLRVAAFCVPLIKRGATRDQALSTAQRQALRKTRWRDATSVQAVSFSSNPTMTNYLKQIHAMSREEVAAMLQATADLGGSGAAAEAAPPSKAEAEGTGTSLVRWTQREWCLIVRMVDYLRAAGDQRHIATVVHKAQALVLPADRQREFNGIRQAAYTHKGKGIDNKLTDARSHVWLLKDVPFQPPGEAQALAVDAPSVREALAATTSSEPSAVAAAAPPPPPPARLVAGPTPRQSITEAAQAFGVTVMGALDALLVAHSANMLDSLNERLGRLMDKAAANTARQVASMVEATMRQQVYQIIEAELGGPVAAPPATSEAPTASAEPGTESAASDDAEPSLIDTPPPPPPVKKMKVDVVGIAAPGAEQEIRHRINGRSELLELSFYTVDAAGDYKPHRGRHCIMLISEMSRAMKGKFKASGVEPVRVKANPHYVVQAVEELIRAGVH